MSDDANLANEQTNSSPGLGIVLAWVLVIGLLALVGVQLADAQKTTVGSGEVAPEFVLTTFEGPQIVLSELKGKVVVLNIWASWCKPCEQEAVDLEMAWRHYEPRGDVVFIGVDYVDTEKEALAYLERFDITYPNGPDLGTRIYLDYRAAGVPETFIIDREGIIRYTKVGPFLSLEEILAVIDPVLAE